MSAEGKGKRGAAGVSNAKAKPFRLNGGGVYPSSMRGIYAMAGLKKISPYIRNGQTGTSDRKEGKR
jgi:hypothetical protein